MRPDSTTCCGLNSDINITMLQHGRLRCAVQSSSKQSAVVGLHKCPHQSNTLRPDAASTPYRIRPASSRRDQLQLQILCSLSKRADDVLSGECSASQHTLHRQTLSIVVVGGARRACTAGRCVLPLQLIWQDTWRCIGCILLLEDPLQGTRVQATALVHQMPCTGTSSLQHPFGFALAATCSVQVAKACPPGLTSNGITE